MRAVLQRVSTTNVSVAGETIASIGQGLLILLGVAPDDQAADGEWLAAKIAKLRLFPDDTGQMNRSVVDLQGELLVVSQFTLFASTAKGNRPSFNGAARPEIAIPLYELFLKQLESATQRPVRCGRFGAMMEVSLTNSGPVTMLLDSRQRE